MKSHHATVTLSAIQALHLEYIKNTNSIAILDNFGGKFFRNVGFSQKQVAIHVDLLKKIHRIVFQRPVIDEKADEKQSMASLKVELQNAFNEAFEKSIDLFKNALFKKWNGHIIRKEVNQIDNITLNGYLNFSDAALFEAKLREGVGTNGHYILYLSKRFIAIADLDIKKLQALVLSKPDTRCSLNRGENPNPFITDEMLGADKPKLSL